MTSNSTSSPKPRDQFLPGEIACDHCTAKCCRYFALPLQRPKTAEDFDYIRWYLLHRPAAVFTENGTWYLLVLAECQHLQPDNRCGIYEQRPQICRSYSHLECEYEDGWIYDQYFETAEQIAEYAEAVLARRDQFTRTPRPPLLPVLSGTGAS